MTLTRLTSLLKKAVLGWVVAAALSLLVVTASEVVLRLVGYGRTPGFTRNETDSQGQRWVRENWWVTVPFFAPELMRRPQPFRLAEKKAPRTYRIFVLGSSAAMGDPEPSFSIARVLECLLRAAYPDIHFEVINAGITAINSHVVRGIAEDCAKLQPDLFVVYEGNNEVIGPFGPGTIFTPVLRHPFAIRAAILLRGLRIGQALTDLTHRAKPATAGDEDWGGMQMFLRHEIAADDPRLVTTAELFEENLRAIARAGTSSGATVLLGTVLTNQRDFSPFESWHRKGLTKEEIDGWNTAFAKGSASANTNDFSAAERWFREAIAVDEPHAEGHFQLAKILSRQAKVSEARAEFQRALDLDVLRFRTDSKLNDRIRRVAESSGQGVKLVDLRKAAEAQSALGVLGDETLYEHVHLSFRGTYVIAREFFAATVEDLRRRGFTPTGASVQPLAMEEVRRRLAFTTYEQAMIVKELISRLKRPPFTGQSSNAARLAAFQQRDARASLLLNRPESTELIFSIYEQAIAENPADWILQRNFGMALAAFRQGARAKNHLLKALEVIPDDPDTLFSLILAHRLLEETADASRRTEQLRALAPKYPGLAKLE